MSVFRRIMAKSIIHPYPDANTALASLSSENRGLKIRSVVLIALTIVNYFLINFYIWIPLFTVTMLVLGSLFLYQKNTKVLLDKTIVDDVLNS